ncbi:MAG: M3 family oligoendopeptidase [Alphaproteobacteria bacterium]|nr:M3 family oligoendopeptidase [Alphaproteobacteria bacterium]
MTQTVKKGSASLGDLPVWNLDDLYKGTNDPKLTADLDAAAKIARDLNARYAGKLNGLDGEGLATVLEAYEGLSEMLGRISSYGFLYYCTDMQESARATFNQTIQERVSDISTDLLFVTLEINKIEEASLQKILTACRLARFKPWIRDTRAFQPYQLSDEVEKLLHERNVVGTAAWSRLFDETLAGLRCTIGGKSLTTSEVLNLLSNKDRTVRREAGTALSGVLNDNIRLFALVFNTLIKEKEIDDRWRGYKLPISSRNVSNQVEDEVVDALTSAVRAAYPNLSHRYYALKARWLGLDKLEYYDRSAPLPDDDDRVIPWPEAIETVLTSYAAFSPELAKIGKRFFDENWIHAPIGPGKASGAFAHGTVPSAHPYLLVNYQGKTRDVMTLAHELGHGVHNVLSGPNGPLMMSTPLTLAETASVFGEQLTFRSLLNAETDKKRRRVMIAGKVEDMINTVVRQVAFCDFERRMHDERRKGELSPEAIGEIWFSIQRESLGPAIHFNDDYRPYWAYISHFIHSPFYVYAYAFGDCLVNALYAVYQDAARGFQEKYLTMLRAGSTLRHKELLAPFGLDASDPKFWSKGLGVISGLIDELETEL